MFAPKIIPIACVNDKISAFTKLTTITVVALEDWIIEVTKSPVRTAVTRFPEIMLNKFWSLFPAPFWIPLLSKSIPKSKSANAPINPKAAETIDKNISPPTLISVKSI